MSMVMGGCHLCGDGGTADLQDDINWLIDSLRPWDLSQIEFRS